MISSFEGPHRFLSNFDDEYSFPIFINWRVGRHVAKTGEHAFQAHKTLDRELVERILNASHPRDAKREGRRVKLRHDWDSVKNAVMSYVVQCKFEVPEYREKLLATGDQILVEGNSWDDDYWGACWQPYAAEDLSRKIDEEQYIQTLHLLDGNAIWRVSEMTGLALIGRNQLGVTLMRARSAIRRAK